MPPAKRTHWFTPPVLFDKLAAEFGPFDLDPCGAADSYASQQCRVSWSYGGLVEPWYGRVFINPPYGRGLEAWVHKAHQEFKLGNAQCVVALLPARVDTIWWHSYVGERCQLAEVRFLKGRVKFVGATASAPFPSVIVAWRHEATP
jgi:hypothetical protein